MSTLGTFNNGFSSVVAGTNSTTPLTINSAAGIQICNNSGVQLGSVCNISSTGVFNCSGLTITGPLTCSSLIIPNNGTITCLGSLICNSTLNMNNNAITGVTSLEYSGTLNSTYSSLPIISTNSIGYVYSTSIVSGQVCSGTKLIATISNLPIGVYAITYQVNFNAFSPASQRIKTFIGTTTTGNQVAGILMTQVSVNDYQGCCSTIYYNNTSIQSIYLNVSLNPGVSCNTYTESSNSSYFQAIKIA